MSEYDSPNYSRFNYERKNEGSILWQRILMILGYVAFAIGFIVACVAIPILPLMCLTPFLVWIVWMCTWRFVSYDYYFEFKSGMLDLGTVRVTRYGKKQKPVVSIHVKEALVATVYDPATCDTSDIAKVYNFSNSIKSENRIFMVFEKGGERCAAIFEGTAKIANLIASFCDKDKSLKGKKLNG